jgi:hypothetical protein
MILKKTPKFESVFFSNNPIEIQLQSELGANHFFVVEIKINDVQFDIQSWGKINNIDCYINLSGQFENIFKNEFLTPTQIEIVANNSLFKKVSVFVKEYNSDSLLEVAAEILPDFYLLQNADPTEFDDAKELILLSELATLNKIDASSIISLPVWINASLATFKIVDNNSQQLFSNEIATVKGLYEFKIPMAVLNVQGLTDITVSVIIGAFSISKTYYLKDNFRYEKTALAVRNTFGFFEYCSFFGILTKTPKYKRTIVSTYLDVRANVEQDHEIAYKLNTGFLTPDQTVSIDKLNKSKDAYLLEAGAYKNILITTKSTLEKETNTFAISNEILFEDNFKKSAEEIEKYNLI